MAGLPRRPFCVGFAAETDNVIGYADEKRRRKGLDLIAANQVGIPDGGFESDSNSLHVLWEGGERHLPRADKRRLAGELIALIAERFLAATARREPPRRAGTGD